MSSVVRYKVQSKTEINRTYRGNHILLQKDDYLRNWYIIVTGKGSKLIKF